MIIKKPQQETGATIKAKLEALANEDSLLISALQETETLKVLTSDERTVLASLSTNGGRTPYVFTYHVITPSTTGQTVYEAEGLLDALPVTAKCILESVYAKVSSVLSGGDLVITVKRNGAAQTPTFTIVSGEQSNSYTFSSPVAYAKDDILTVSFDAGAIQTGVSLFFALYFSHNNT